MKFDRQLQPATETSWVVSYGGKTIPRWRTAAILKIDISPYLSEKSSDFHEILYTAADFKLDERHVIKNEKVALDRLRVRQNVFLVAHKTHYCCSNTTDRQTQRHQSPRTTTPAPPFLFPPVSPPPSPFFPPSLYFPFPSPLLPFSSLPVFLLFLPRSNPQIQLWIWGSAVSSQRGSGAEPQVLFCAEQ